MFSGFRASFSNYSLLVSLLLTVSVSVSAQSITILAPEIPGHSQADGKGRDIEIVSKVLGRCGYEAEYVVQPYGRHIRSFEDRSEFDGVMTVPLADETPWHGTAAYIWYQNGVVYVRSRTGRIRDLVELSGRPVVTFAKGKQILELESEIGSTDDVYEIPNQSLHPEMLLRGRVDAVLAEFLAFEVVFDQIIEGDPDLARLARFSDIRMVPLFKPTPYKMVFRDAEIAAAFDQCFNQLLAEGELMEIGSEYITTVADLFEEFGGGSDRLMRRQSLLP